MEKLPNKFKLTLCGCLVGVINGLLGGGGGMLVVPAIQGLLKQEAKTAHATAILIILPVTIVSAIVYIISGKTDWNMILYSSIGVVAGGIAGAFALSKLSNKWIKLIFCGIMVAAGVKMLFF